MKPKLTETIDGLTLNVYHDENEQGPDDYGDESLLLLHFHRNFHVERPDIASESEVAAWCRGKRADCRDMVRKFHVFPVTAYIHSGVSLSLGTGTPPFDPGGWDTSHVGVVLAARSKWKRRDKAEKAAANLVETWNQYLSGDVWGYVVETADGEHVDSCWGFYGFDYACEKARAPARASAKARQAADADAQRTMAL